MALLTIESGLTKWDEHGRPAAWGHVLRTAPPEQVSALLSSYLRKPLSGRFVDSVQKHAGMTRG